MSTPADHRAEVREFLTSRRARITPEQAGLPAYGGAKRRVAGLRREEVALLAGVSIDYYVRMERGNLTGASDAVLDGVASALQLDEAERAHLYDLARAAQKGPVRQRSRGGGITAGVQQLLDAMSDAPAWVRNARHDMLAVNTMARALYAPLLASDPTRCPNTARFVYLHPASKDFFVDWERSADDIAAMLRSEAGRNPYDKKLIDLIGELSTRSDEFRTRWAAHNVRFHRTGKKKLRHPAVGAMELDYEAMQFPAHPELTMLAYTAAAGTPAADSLKLLASWAATADASGEMRPLIR
ncbi:helix-turn-helix transcriptional regulator [Gordonia sp. VNQ95]|uniref:helix-turn-helix transcriptional regulator n=1 Tax=Gordonia sp. VNQ95 TaxID=3156619 RepID=UPI0032B4C485